MRFRSSGCLPFKIMKRGLSVMLLVVWIVFHSRLLSAYTDDIQADADEIFQAAQAVLEPVGIHKSDPAARKIESRWIEDEVVRSRRVMPMGSRTRYKQKVERRYRIRIQCKQTDSLTQVTVKGVFQDKLDSPHPIAQWRAVKPQLVDYSVEREYFFKLLRQLGENH